MRLRALAVQLAFALAVMVGLAAPISPALAHVRSESHAVWEIDGANIDMVLTVTAADLKTLGKGDTPTDATIKAYMAQRVYPLSGERRCTLVPPVESLGATPGFRKFDFTFHCPAATALRIHFGGLFDVIPSHTDFGQIQNVATGEFTEQLFTNERQDVDVSEASGGKLQSASFLDFISMGVMHIFTGVDHMSFLVGLVLISRRLRDLVFVVTGFTLGHSLTLALAVTGVLRPHAEYIDALVALTIALIGAENVAVATGRPGLVALCLAAALGLMAVLKWLGLGDLPSLLLLGAGLFAANYLMITSHVKEAGRLRLVITLVFGLIHGFGFASNLLEMQLPTGRLAELLVGFNLGVEIGQMSLVLGVTLLVLGLRRMQLALPRPIVVDTASSVLVGLGVYWFVSRSFG